MMFYDKLDRVFIKIGEKVSLIYYLPKNYFQKQYNRLKDWATRKYWVLWFEYRIKSNEYHQSLNMDAKKLTRIGVTGPKAEKYFTKLGRKREVADILDRDPDDPIRRAFLGGKNYLLNKERRKHL